MRCSCIHENTRVSYGSVIVHLLSALQGVTLPAFAFRLGENKLSCVSELYLRTVLLDGQLASELLLDGFYHSKTVLSLDTES